MLMLMKKRYLLTICCLLVLLSGRPVYAASLSDADMESMSWMKVREEPLLTKDGNVQGMCATDKYILTIENTADDPAVPDIVTAYYKYNTDENGNPVERFSVVRRNDSREWEHGNGMAYNPRTNEVYVALYTNTVPENRGCLYVMDPETLEYKRTVKVTDDFNILGIAYLEDKDQYVIQSNADGGYRFQILDSAFHLVKDLGAADISPGNNSQDMGVVEGYIVNSPCIGATPYLNIYSIADGSRVATLEPKIEEADLNADAAFELESVAELTPGHLLFVGRSYRTGSPSCICFYETFLPVSLFSKQKVSDLYASGALVAAGIENTKITARTAPLRYQSVWKSVISGIRIPRVTVNGWTAVAVLSSFAAAGLGLLGVYVHVRLERKRKRIAARRYRAAYQY